MVGAKEVILDEVTYRVHPDGRCEIASWALTNNYRTAYIRRWRPVTSDRLVKQLQRLAKRKR